MGNKYKVAPKYKGCNSVRFECDYCKIECFESASAYNKKKKHFCSMACYVAFRKHMLPYYEQHAYKGVRKPGETKQVYHRNYCKSNPENIAHLKARRYAREKNAEGSHTLEEWKTLKIKYNNKCANCGEEKPLTKDHIIPLSEGGTDYINNIQPMCRNCNSKKWKHIYEHPTLLNQSNLK